MASYRWDDGAGRYRSANGQFLAEKVVRDAVDRVADLASDKLGALAQQLRAGTLSLGEFQTQSMAVIKDSTNASAMTAYGGRQEMNQSRWGRNGATIKEQYKFHRQFAADIASGAQPLDGRLDNRNRLYGDHARVAYESIRSREDAARGMDEASNVLHATQSCSQCIGITAQGWMPSSEMIPVGSRTCRSRCKCTLKRRRSAKREAA